MKKNITINIYGSLYAIDEDAYTLLDKYLNETKRYFMKSEGGDEIADDIEHRVAELLCEMKAEGKEAVTLEDIETIIRRIGNPEEMDREARDSMGEPEGQTENTNFTSEDVPPHPHVGLGTWDTLRSRKLYRCADDKLLGGVLSGICRYFGGTDPLPWRLLFVVFSLMSLLTFTVVYIIFWCIVPQARTPEDRLRMKGKEVNMENINEEIMQNADRKPNTRSTPNAPASFFRELMNIVLLILVYSIKAVALIITVPIFIGTLICDFIWVWAAFGGMSTLTQLDILDERWQGITEIQPMVTVLTGLTLLFASIFWACALFIIIRSLFYTNENDNLSHKTRLALTWTTILSAILSMGITASACILFKEAEEQYEIASNTINGVYLKKGHRDRLNRNGWTICTYDNCNAQGTLYRSVRSLTDKDDQVWVMRFKQNKKDKPMQVQLKQDIYYPAGTYRLEAIVSAKSPGAYIYAQTGTDSLSFATIPVDDADGCGNMKYFYDSKEDNQILKREYADNNTLQTFTPDIAQYWSYIQTAPFHHQGGMITIGTTNMGSVVRLPEQPLSASTYSVYSLKLIPDNI